MKLGLKLWYSPLMQYADLVQEAEHLGYDSVWTGETWGQDALASLAWAGSRTSRIKLGTNIAQLAARTPTAAAMTAMTLDHLSGGRFILGLGASGPQVVEGWFGQPYPKPLARTREYVEIIRKVLRRDAPVTYQGEFYTLPYDGGARLGKPLKTIIHPLREDLPVYLAAIGPKNLELAGEIADGLLPIFYSPKTDGYFREALGRGFAKPGARRSAADFEIAAAVPVVVDDDLEAAYDKLRPMLALYIGGMGAKGANFYFDNFVRLGYEAEATVIQDLYLAGKKAEATAAVPVELIEDVALVGPKAKIKDDLQKWRETLVTTLVVDGDAEQLRAIAEVVLD
ncbi:MAG: LLM class F420-dependent oxidoreductase [Segniliparus sp.]|uniref:LLM class F420-dependent oxidoreductase n=1 Tax=Segniliparus sp. TaxID=2804064 RepID=UPI003F2CE52D